MKEVIIAFSLFVDDDYDLEDEEQFEEGVWDAFESQVLSSSFSFGLCDYVIVPNDINRRR